MSAVDDVLAPTDIAWRLMREGNGGSGLSYDEVFEAAVLKVALEFLDVADYDRATLNRIVMMTPPGDQAAFCDWMGHVVEETDEARYAAAFATVELLRMLVGQTPYFGGDPTDFWMYLGRFPRSYDEFPLTADETFPPDGQYLVDLWGAIDGRQVKIRYGPSVYNARAGNIASGPADSHDAEAFRRLALKLAP